MNGVYLTDSTMKILVRVGVAGGVLIIIIVVIITCIKR